MSSSTRWTPPISHVRGIPLGRTAQLKKTSEQRCREAFEAWAGPLKGSPQHEDVIRLQWHTWEACWKHLEARLLEEIQS